MAYTTIKQIRRITNITIQDIENTELNELIIDATSQLNSDINTSVVRELVLPLDNTRRNYVNGVNTTFYVKNWRGKYIGDRNDDGEITPADVIVHFVAPDGTETVGTVSSVTSDEGKFVLSSAPTRQEATNMYVSYHWCFENPDTPSGKISLACALLVAAYSYEKINRGMSPQQVYGNVRFMRDMRAGNEYFQRYENEIAKINAAMGDYGEAEVF